MIINGPDRHGETFEADVCIVGAGVAGLTLAVSLAQRGITVVLVESGGLQFQERSHKLLDVEVTGWGVRSTLMGARERYFGGTSNHWGGTCLTLDEFEFEPHSWMAHSGWPFKQAELNPYYAAAARFMHLSLQDQVYDADALGVGGRARLVSASSASFDSHILRAPPYQQRKMGQWLLGEVERSQNIQCLLNTTIAEILPDASRERVKSLEGRTFEQGTLYFRAKDYVLCSSTIENARLLLVSDSIVKGGLGNAHDLVGRYFMDHPARGIGMLLLTGSKADASQEEFLSQSFADAYAADYFQGQRMVAWSTSPAFREQRQLQGFGAFLVPGEIPVPLPHERAIQALLESEAKSAQPAPAPRKYFVAGIWEQSPNPDSRVTLSSERDALGIRKPILHWELTDADLSSARESLKALSLEIARSAQGRMHLMDMNWDKQAFGTGHHMGTTRMSNDARYGVTDVNGRVHSLENLFISGASVYPTGGWQHPTFTIIALALRQADMLVPRSV